MRNVYTIRQSPIVMVSALVALFITIVSLVAPVFLFGPDNLSPKSVLVSIFLLIISIFVYTLKFRLKIYLYSSKLTISAPLWKKEILYSDISYISSESDSGVNRGLINWPVVKTDKGYRFNMGGSCCIKILSQDGKTYEIVMENIDQAGRFQNDIERAIHKG